MRLLTETFHLVSDLRFHRLLSRPIEHFAASQHSLSLISYLPFFPSLCLNTISPACLASLHLTKSIFFTHQWEAFALYSELSAQTRLILLRWRGLSELLMRRPDNTPTHVLISLSVSNSCFSNLSFLRVKISPFKCFFTPSRLAFH